MIVVFTYSHFCTENLLGILITQRVSKKLREEEEKEEDLFYFIYLQLQTLNGRVSCIDNLEFSI